MTRLVTDVYNSIKRKKSAVSEAKRLGISTVEYIDIKNKILELVNNIGDKVDEAVLGYIVPHFIGTGKTEITQKDISEAIDETAISRVTSIHQDLDKGTGKITGIATTEPRSSEEIIKLLNIDTNVWKLSQYWNKEQANGWLVSALVTKLPQEDQDQATFLELLENYEVPEIKPVKKIKQATSKDKVCGIISMQDLHFGKDDPEELTKVMIESLENLGAKAANNYYVEELILVLGADTLQFDTWNGETTKGTFVQSKIGAADTYMSAFDACVKGITVLKQYCEKLRVIYIPGNHDRLSGFHLLHALQQSFNQWKDITFDLEHTDRKVVIYGENFFAFEHGDRKAPQKEGLLFACEYPKQWGETTWRMVYRGHIHGRLAKEYVTEYEEHGFIVRHLPALTTSDYWHRHNKFTHRRRSTLIHLHDKTQGLVAEFAHNVGFAS